MKLRTSLAALSLAVVAPLTLVACGTDDTASTTTASTTTTTSSAAATTEEEEAAPVAGDGRGAAGGGPGGTDVDSVTTEAALVQLVQEAYGEASLGLHRGHQPIEDVLAAVLVISHDELHVRMEEQGQNLAAVAEDLDIDPQTLIDALVTKYTPAIDALAAAGTITTDQGDAYVAALEEAFTYRVTWDGAEATPTFTGL